MILLYLFLTHTLSLWYSSIFYWLTCYPYGTPLFSSGPLAFPMVLYYLLLARRLSYDTLLSSFPADFCCCTLLSSTGPLAISIVLYCFLLAHWLSLWYYTIFYWPIAVVLYCLLLAQWLSRWYSTIFYWPTGYPYSTYYFQLAHRISL